MIYIKKFIYYFFENFIKSIFFPLYSKFRRSPSCELARFLELASKLAAEDRARRPLSCPAENGPVISLVTPVYDTPVWYLDDLLASFRREAALCPGMFELIFADDGSTAPDTLCWLAKLAPEQSDVRLVLAAANRGTAAAINRGATVARGIWIGVIDHDDALAPYAADRILRALQEHPDCRFLYTDEVVTDGALRPEGLFLKPAFDPVLLSGVNYLNHLSLYRRDLFLEIGGLREDFQGSQDYDLALRYTSLLEPHHILHLPYPAYLWRRDGKSYSAKHIDVATSNARRALREHWSRGKEDLHVSDAFGAGLHHVRFDHRTRDWPHVSVIIPSREQPSLIRQVLTGLAKTDYPSFDVIVVDNGSTSDEVFMVYRQLENGPFAFCVELREEPFNFSRSVNRGLVLAKGEVLLLLNNDVEVEDAGWLKEMVSCLDYPDTGVVGARLLYPDRRLQHAGVIVGFGGLAGHWFVGEPADSPGPMGRLRVRQSMSAVTGACLLVTRACLDEIGTLDEDAFAIAYNDVDLCMRAVKAGYRVVWTPFATLVHHESASRGSDVVPENILRFQREQDNLRERHGTDIYEDPAINPWYTKDRSNPGLQELAFLPSPRRGFPPRRRA